MKNSVPQLLCILLLIGGCAANTQPLPVSVLISPASANVLPGTTAQFTAMVSGDSASRGVTWMVACSAQQCGSVSPTSTPSGSPTTYTAPSSPAAGLTVTITAVSVADNSKTAAATVSVTAPAIQIAVAPANVSVATRGTQQFTAAVANDPSNKGVAWTLTQGGTACSPGCGTIAPATTASGSPATFTAPATVPANPNVTVVATSAADSSFSATAAVTILGTGVSLSPTTANVRVTATQQFTATVVNDPSNSGVAWTLTQSGTPCAPACGTISPATTASGAATTYTAPSTSPTPAQVTVTAASVADATKSAAATVTITASVAVSVNPATASVNVTATQQFTATVTNDPGNKGVTWTLTQGGTGCSPGCGTIAPAVTPSGSPATYTAPATVPANPSVTVVATSVADTTISSTATVTVSGAAVSVSPTTATVTVMATQQFTATVTNDPSNSGVTWTLSQSGTACAPACGTISPITTASGAATTYTAPSAVPSPASVTVTAASVADATKSATATVTVSPPITVSVAPAAPSVLVSGTQQFTATVTNDASNGGVSWSLTQNGTSCSPGCGMISPASTASGTPTTYTAPASVPIPAGVTITATSVADSKQSATAAITVTGTCGTGNESLLNGQYAFLLQGFDSHGPVGIAGSFDADGAGNIAKLVGVEDINTAAGPQINLTILSTGSSYSIGPDHRGCMTLVNSAGMTNTYRFAVASITGTPGIATKGRIVEFDDAFGKGTRTAGELRLQNPASFSNAQFTGPYTFGFYGQDGGGSRFSVAGTFISNGSGAITGGTFDSDEGGGLTANTPVDSGSYAIGSNGRGTIGITAIGVTNHFAMYMINASDAFFMSTDSLTLDPIFGGEALASSATPFTNSSLKGAAVLHLTGNSSSGDDAILVLATADGAGNLSSFQLFQNLAGTFSTQNLTTGTYSVAANGRVTLSGVGSTPPVIYLSGQNEGFAVGTGSLSEIGRMEAQAAGPFSTASFSGTYLFGTENCGSPFVALETGIANPSGAAGTGIGTSDQADGGGTLLPNGQFNFTYSFSADGTGNVGPGTTAILISGNRFVYMENTLSPSRITVTEQ